MLTLLAAFVPAVCYCIAVWYWDAAEREPVRIVGLVFLWGAIGAVLFSLFGSLMPTLVASAVLGARAGDFLGAVVVAPVVEEIAKALPLWLLVGRRKYLDGRVDGLVYGAASGLGFAMTENVLYFSQADSPEQWAVLVVVRTLFSMNVHLLATGTHGFLLGMLRERGARLGANAGAVALACVAAMGIHAAWNFFASFDIFGPEVGMAGKLTGIGFVIVSWLILLGVAIGAARQEGRQIAFELEEEERLGVIPPGHARLLANPILRENPRTYPSGFARRRYVLAGVRLAVEKRRERLRWAAVLRETAPAPAGTAALSAAEHATRAARAHYIDTLRADLRATLGLPSWYVALDGRILGTLSDNALLSEVQARRIPPTAMVWKPGHPGWLPVGAAAHEIAHRSATLAERLESGGAPDSAG